MTERIENPQAPAPRRGGALPAMAIGAAIGLVAGQALETATGGADPAFAGGVGGVLGAALGRSGWIRISAARARGRSTSLALGVLVGRIVGCALLGLAFVASLGGSRGHAVPLTTVQQIAVGIVGIALLVSTAVIEQRWLRARPDMTSAGGPNHGD